MHELAICHGLLDELMALATQRAANRVLSVQLCVGPLAGVEATALRQAFTLVAAGTVAEGAELTIDQRVVRLRCDQCGCEADAPHINHLTCPSCGSWRTTVLEGAELLLTRVELETPADLPGRAAREPQATPRPN